MKKLLFFALLAPGLIMSCGDDDSDNAPATASIDLNLSGLDNLGSTEQYEGWILLSDGPKSTGTFTVDGTGKLSATSFTVDAADLAAASKFILTIEPIPDADPKPSELKIIAGDFSGNSAAVSTSVAPALGSGVDFSSAAGKLFLRTPTDEEPGSENNMNDAYGVWFGTPNPAGPPTSGLTLPTLPAGWIYEGWVVGDKGAISTGTFSSFTTQDSGNPFSGTANNVGPPVPGEDFFMDNEAAPTGETFPLSVLGRTVVISVEPVPDNSPAPFLLKPLGVMLAADAATAPETHEFNKGALPTGTVTR